MCGDYVPLLKLLVQTLNFTIDWVHATDNRFGVMDLDSGEWVGTIGLLAKKEAEIAPLLFFITSSRESVVDFSSPITNYGGHLYMKKPRLSVSWGTFYEIFRQKYWLALVVSTLFISIVLGGFFMIYDRPHLKYNCCVGILQKVFSGFSMVCLSFACQDVLIGAPNKIKTSNSFRIIFLTTCVFGMVNFYTYSVGLISFLMVENYELPIKDLSDFLKKPDYQLMIEDDGLKLYFSEANSWPHDMIWAETLKDNPDAHASSAIDADTTLMNDPKRVLLSTPDGALGLPNYPCNIVKLKNEYSKKSLGYTFQKDSPYISLFSKTIIDFAEFGNFHYISEMQQRTKSSVPCSNENHYRSLSYNNIFSIFILLVIGIVISALHCIIESVYFTFLK